MVRLVDKYKSEADMITKTLMTLAVVSNIDYDTLLDMTPNERNILVEVIKEKRKAENPGTNTQEYL